jgi:hypothetical protein
MLHVARTRETHHANGGIQRPGPQLFSSAISSRKAQRKWTHKNISPRFTSGNFAKQLSGFQLEP